MTGISIGGDGVRGGWTVGAGIDYAITNNSFAGLEFRYSQYQARTVTYPIPIAGIGIIGLQQKLDNNQISARLGYNF